MYIYSSIGLGKFRSRPASTSQIRLPKGTVFDAKTVPKRYTKQSKWNPKGCQNEQRNLQRHPCGTESNKYRKRVPKYTNGGGPIFGSKPIKKSKRYPQNIQKSVTGEYEQDCQNDAQRDPEIIDVSSCSGKGEFRQMMVLPSENAAV